MSSKIDFNILNADCKPGEAVTGKVTIENKTPIEATCLKMTMYVVFGIKNPEQKPKEPKNKTTGSSHCADLSTKPFHIFETTVQLAEDDKRKTVTVPTGVGIEESIPIHILIVNETKKAASIVRSKFIRRHRNPPGFIPFGDVTENIKSENIEEIKESSGNQLMHSLPLTKCDPTFNSPHMAMSYFIQVEVETSSSVVLKMEFPIIVGSWNGTAVRQDLKQYLESINVTPTIPFFPAASPVFPTASRVFPTAKPIILDAPLPHFKNYQACLKVVLDFPDGKYTVGDCVSGSVILQNSVPIVISGLKASMFLESKMVLTDEAMGPLKETFKNDLDSLSFITGENPRMIQYMTIHLDEEKARQPRHYPIGTHSFRFIFSALPFNSYLTRNDYFSYIRYFVKAELDIHLGGGFKAMKYFILRNCPLDAIEAAQKWQTKTDSALSELSMKGISMKVTVPTGVGTNETVDFHISISSDSREPMVIIRSRLIQRKQNKLEALVRSTGRTNFSLPSGLDSDSVEGENTEEIYNVFNYQRIHSLKINKSRSSADDPFMQVLHFIQVEMETSDSTILKVQFPVTVGEWRGKPVRPDVEKYLESINEKILPSVPTVSPSAPPEEYVFISPPSYDDACKTAPQLFPSLPVKF